MLAERVMLKPADIAPLLGVTTGRVYQLISSGVLPATRIGRSVRIPRDLWIAWLKRQSRLAASAPKTGAR
jgi:excisionase family DNA binding protein